jgi:anti-sigma B factor antagonist
LTFGQATDIDGFIGTGSPLAWPWDSGMLSYIGHEASGVLVFVVEDDPANEGGMMAQREALYKMIEGREDPRFVIDLGAVQYMQSSEIGVLITLKRRIDARKGKVVLVNVDPFIYDILRTMRIDKLFTIAPDLASAVKAMSG